MGTTFCGSTNAISATCKQRWPWASASGSLVTGYLSDGKIEYGLIPLGAAGMTVFGFLSAGHGLSLERAAAYLACWDFSAAFTPCL